MQISIINISDVKSQINSRLDAEYWHPEAMRITNKIGTDQVLGDLIADGYRIVYENTKIIRQKHTQDDNLPKFIQAADIDYPIINVENSGCVHESDWHRYPKGRVKKGEILLEVKGNVRKVAVVPTDFPEKVLISGTIYKFSVISTTNKFYLAVYLSSDSGQKLKNRLVTNIGTPFINKDELHQIPVPKFSKYFEGLIENIYLESIEKINTSNTIYKDAIVFLLAELGLSNWRPKHHLTFIKNYSDTEHAERIDAEYFQPNMRKS